MKRIALPLLLLALAACGGSGPSSSGGGNSGGGVTPQPPAPAGSLAYEDPLDASRWRLVRNSDSTPDLLVLDLMPPEGGSGMGVTLEASVPAALATWVGAAPALGCPYQGALVQRIAADGGTLRFLLSQRPPMAPVRYDRTPVATFVLKRVAGSPLGPVSMTVGNAGHLSGPLARPETIAPQPGVLRIQ